MTDMVTVGACIGIAVVCLGYVYYKIRRENPQRDLLGRWQKFRKWDCESRGMAYKYDDGKGREDG